ncbi:hypothetical protein FQZ97_848950 [compost metagenome]
MIDLVVRRAGEEELQGTPHFLGHALDEGLQHGALVVLGQISRALLGFGLIRGEPVLANDELCELSAAKGLVTLVEHFIVADDLQAGGHRSDFEQGHQRINALIGQGLDDPASGKAGGVGLDIHDHRLEPGRFGQALTVRNFFLARRSNQDLDVAH